MKPSHRESLSELLLRNNETVDSLERALKISTWNEFEAMGIGLLLSDIYQGVEQVLAFFVEKIRNSLRGMLRYRHAQRHGYGVKLDAERVRTNAPDAIATYRIFERHIKKRGD